MFEEYLSAVLKLGVDALDCLLHVLAGYAARGVSSCQQVHDGVGVSLVYAKETDF